MSRKHKTQKPRRGNAPPLPRPNDAAPPVERVRLHPRFRIPAIVPIVLPLLLVCVTLGVILLCTPAPREDVPSPVPSVVAHNTPKPKARRAHPPSMLITGTPPRLDAQTTAEQEEEIAIADYLAALLINEIPFPGEPAFKNADDSKAAMQAILWTLQHRRTSPPKGYTRQQVAATASTNLVDIITAFNQVEGFYKTATARHTVKPRVKERVAYLRLLARRADTPTIAELFDYAHAVALDYIQSDALPFDDPFLTLTNLPPDAVEVTGSSYGWMTDDPVFHPGGNFVRIPDDCGGALGGNRFFTLRKTPQPVTNTVAKIALDATPPN